MVFTFSVLNRKYPFSENLAQKIKNCQFKMKLGTWTTLMVHISRISRLSTKSTKLNPREKSGKKYLIREFFEFQKIIFLMPNNNEFCVCFGAVSLNWKNISEFPIREICKKFENRQSAKFELI